MALTNGLSQDPTFPFVDSNLTVSIPLNRALSPVIRLADENLAGVDLRLGIGPTHVFKFTPLQMVDNVNDPTHYIPFPLTPALNYVDLFPFMTHVPKNSKLICATCATLPVLGSNLGVDGFSIPMENLNGGTVTENRSAWPGKKFQALKIELTYFTGSGGAIAGGQFQAVMQRCLLQATLPSDKYQLTYNGDGSVNSIFVVHIVDGVAEVIPLEQWGGEPLPSYADEALGTSILAVLFANIVIYLLSYKLTK